MLLVVMMLCTISLLQSSSNLSLQSNRCTWLICNIWYYEINCLNDIQMALCWQVYRQAFDHRQNRPCLNKLWYVKRFHAFNMDVRHFSSIWIIADLVFHCTCRNKAATCVNVTVWLIDTRVNDSTIINLLCCKSIFVNKHIDNIFWIPFFLLT